MLEVMIPECVETIIKKLALQAHKIEYKFVEEKRKFIGSNMQNGFSITYFTAKSFV